MTLRELRFRKKISQMDLALAIGTCQARFSLIERGYVQPRQEELDKIARILGVDPAKLTFDQPNRISA